MYFNWIFTCMNKIIKEYLIKNAVILLLLLFSFFVITVYLESSGISGDKDSSGNMLIATSIIAVVACFGNFAFTYEKTNLNSLSSRVLGHLITGFLTLVIGISLIFTDIWIY